MRRGLSIAFAVVSVAGSSLALPAFATVKKATPPPGNILFYGAEVKPSNGNVVITGRFVDHGSISDSGNTEKVTMSNGSFQLNMTKLAKQSVPVVNKVNCAFTSVVTGSAPLSAGAGVYKGMQGTLMITAVTSGIMPKKSGKCSTSAATPVAYIRSLNGSGAVKFT